MKNLTMYCLSLNPNHLDTIKKFNYVPVGLGKETFSKEWFRDNTGENISYKNKYYGEYTFHYWIWKNYLDKIQDGWIGFCQYRKFWSVADLIKNKSFETSKEIVHKFLVSTKNDDSKSDPSGSLDKLNSLVLKQIPNEYEDFDVILGELMPINKLKLMNVLKRGLGTVLRNPIVLLDREKRNIKFHFDMWHGHNYLSKAIELLDETNRDDFNYFVNTECSFNPENMFICKSKKIIKNYYETIFPWFARCEKEFGLEKLSGYENRLYGFLAERFLSYWFKKNTKYKTMPIIFYDIRKNFN